MSWGRGRLAGIVGAAVIVLVSTGCIRDVGLPPGLDTARAVAVNARGDAIVDGYDSALGRDGFVLTLAGEWTQPGTDAPGLDVTSIRYEAINEQGAVVGDLSLSHDNPTNPQRGNDMQFVWDPARGLREIGLNGGNRVNPVDIADDGAIAAHGHVGTVWFGSYRGYLVDGETLARRELGPLVLGGSSWASAVNTRGEVAGTSGGRYVLWAPPLYWPVALTPATATDHTDPRYIDLNDRGEVVATVLAPLPERMHGLYWDAQRTVTRMPDGFLPEAIDDDGTVVGAVWRLPATSGETVSAPRAATWRPGDAAATLLTADPDRPDSVAAGIAGDHIVGWHAPAGAPWADENTPVRWAR